MECKLVNYSIKLIYNLRCVKLVDRKVPPYFHAEYNNHEAAFAIENLLMMEVLILLISKKLFPMIHVQLFLL